MQEPELIAKTLRAVLHPFKSGVPLSELQSEYKSLTGEWIPFRHLGYGTLEGYLESIPGVVRMEGSKMGEVICHAVACSETEPIAQLVARQRSSKRKTGRQVNCQMRLKNTSPVKLAGKPKGTLRQPRSLSVPEEGSKRPVPRLPRSRGVACGVVKPTVESARLALSPAAGSGSPKETPMQRHVTVVNRPEKRLTVPPRFQKELQVHLSRSSSIDSNDNLNTSTAKKNYRHWCAAWKIGHMEEWPDNVDFILKDISTAAMDMKSLTLDAVVLDMLNPQSALPVVQPSLKQGGVCTVYLANITQVIDLLDRIRTSRLPFLCEKIIEVTHRDWLVLPAKIKNFKSSQAVETLENIEETPQKEYEENYIQDQVVLTEGEYNESLSDDTETHCSVPYIARPSSWQDAHSAFLIKLRKFGPLHA